MRSTAHPVDGTYRRVFNCHWTRLPSEFKFRRLTEAERVRIHERVEELAGAYEWVSNKVRGDLLEAAIHELLREAHSSEEGPVYESTRLWTDDDLRRNDESEDAIGRGLPEYHVQIAQTIMETEYGAKFQPYVPDTTDYYEWLGRAARVRSTSPVPVMTIRKTPAGRRVVAVRRSKTRRTRGSPRDADPHEPDLADRRLLAGVFS